MWDNTLLLVNTSNKKDGIGNQVVNVNGMTEVYCNELSVSRAEFYQAIKADLQPSIVFEIKPYEYDNEKYIIYNDVYYDVIRTYKKDFETLELTCKLGGASWQKI